MRVLLGIRVVKVMRSMLLIRGIYRFLVGILSSWHLQSALKERSRIEVKGGQLEVFIEGNCCCPSTRVSITPASMIMNVNDSDDSSYQTRDMYPE